MPVAFERLTHELPGQASHPNESWSTRIWKADFWYQSLMSLGGNKSTVDYVTVVRISNTEDPESWLSANPCTHRPLMGALVREIAKYKPVLIVVDFWYRPRVLTSCRLPDPTNALQAGVKDASNDVPVIMARDSAEVDELPTFCRPTFPLKPDVEDVLVPSVDFTTSAGQAGVFWGLSRFDNDTRRLPFAFWTYADCAAGLAKRDRKLTPTIAGITSQLLRRTFPNTLMEPESHPFTTFVPEREFPSIHASELVCIPPELITESDQHRCSDETTRRRNLNLLRNRIVIIGEDYYGDMHKTVEGSMSGMAMHGNYIEAILARRYFAAASPIVTIPLTILWFLLIEFVFKRERFSPEAALGISLGLSAVVSFILFSFIRVYWGFYCAVVPPGLLALLGKYLSCRAEKYSVKYKTIEKETRNVS